MARLRSGPELPSTVLERPGLEIFTVPEDLVLWKILDNIPYMSEPIK